MKKRLLSPGRARSLRATATDAGVFTILAVDHRDSLRALLNPRAPEQVPDKALADFKLAVTEQLAPAASGVLLDPITSAGQAIARQALPEHVGLLCALEEQGYLGDPTERQTTLLAGWSVEKTKRLGAQGVKLLLFYHPDAGAATAIQEELVLAVLADCRRYDIPLFLEPISYSPDLEIEKGTPEFSDSLRRIVVESVRRLSALGPDVLKVEFPVDVRFEEDRAVWSEACAELDEASQVPWALLSGGEPFEIFKAQLRIACQAGCSGFMAGRAIWADAVSLKEAERFDYLENDARRRFDELADIALAYGRSFLAAYSLPEIDERWYLEY